MEENPKNEDLQSEGNATDEIDTPNASPDIEESVENEQPDTNPLGESTGQQISKHPHMPGPAIVVAIFVATILVLVGVLAYQNSGEAAEDDSSTNTTEPSGLDVGQDAGPVEEADIQEEIDSLESSLSELEADSSELGDDSLTDSALELEE